MAVVFSGVFLFVLQYIFPSKFGNIISIAGVIISAGAMIYIGQVVRCPKCRAPLGQTYFALRFWPQSKHRLDYCPDCGVDMGTKYGL